jgi:hypothetical protein
MRFVLLMEQIRFDSFIVENLEIYLKKKGLIVDQTIEKVSFCAPDRQRNKGFAYICRDGTTRRWICHGFVTIKETVCFNL